MPSPSRQDPRAQGALAERRATWYLRLRGWHVVARNWMGGGGELDVVAARWWTLLIVEVRSRPTLGEAFVSVDDAKLTRTQTAAQELIRRHGLERYRLRYDVIAIDALGRLERRRDVAFGARI